MEISIYMTKLFVALGVAAAISSPTFAQSIYVLIPVGAGQLNDVLGANAALPASSFYEFMKSTWKIPTVEPTYKNGLVDNVQDLIPYEVFVVPELVTIRASQVQGSQFDYNRQEHGTASPLPVTVNPAEDSVFIYALNKDGKLIYPFVRSNTGDGNDYGSTYSIRTFQKHSNFSFFSQPIVANTDVDISGSYDKNKPNMNPPNALMFRGRTAGRYSLTLAIRFNDQFLSVLTPDDVRALATRKVVSKSVEIDVVNGPETIDGLLFNVSKSLGLQDTSKTLSLQMKVDEVLEVSLSGRKNRKQWKEDLQKYQDDGTSNVMLKEVNWSYGNLVRKPSSPFDADLIFIRKLTADGTSVRIVANKLPPGASEGKGTITIEGHGRRFNVNVTVTK
jgi:hypothetical protein